MNSWMKRSNSAGDMPCRKRMPPSERRSNSDISAWYTVSSEACALMRTPFT
jgi:hypothetical protein